MHAQVDIAIGSFMHSLGCHETSLKLNVNEVFGWKHQGTTKINVAVDTLPRFWACPHSGLGPGPEHFGTIHLGADSMDEIDIAYKDALRGKPSTRPLIEMTIPSVLDNTIAPPGCVQTNFHVYIRWSYRSKEPVLRVCVLTTR
jgi:phytoene dehydrogenase-like protein